jgi:hypothetical protein
LPRFDPGYRAFVARVVEKLRDGNDSIEYFGKFKMFICSSIDFAIENIDLPSSSVLLELLTDEL